MSLSLKILVAHPDEGQRRVLAAMLDAMEHTVVSLVASGQALIADALRLGPDLIISAVQLEGMDGVDALIEASRHEPRPAVIVTTQDDLDKVEEAMQDHVMAYLIQPVTEVDLRPTIYLVHRRFEQFQELRREVKELKAALEARKTIERAKGILMRKRNLSEEDAYQLLRKTANDGRTTIVQVAEALLLAEKMAP